MATSPGIWVTSPNARCRCGNAANAANAANAVNAVNAVRQALRAD